MNRVFVLAAAIALSVGMISAQDAPLPATDIDAAIKTGARMKPKDIGLVLTAKLTFKERLALAAIDTVGGDTTFWEGFAMVLYTPTAWVQVLSSRAATRFESFTGIEGMNTPVLRVFVKPSGLAVLRDTAKTTALRPIATIRCTQTIQFGNDVSDECDEHQFALADVRKLQDAKGEFLVNVQVRGQRFDPDGVHEGEMQRDLKVERKHLQRLPGLSVR